MTSPTAAASQARAGESTPRHPSRRVPYLLLAGVVALAAPLQAAVGPIRDIDYYWHVLVGQDILDGVPVREAARGWSFAPVPDTWVSTQWLAEVLFAASYGVGGLQSALVYRTVTTILVLVTLAVATLWRRPPRAGVWLFTLGALELAMFDQERSQQLTYILAPLVGLWVERAWRGGRVPRWWVVLPVVLVWAQFHGGWVLLPLGLGLASLARVLDHGWRDPIARRLVALAALCLLVACVSPSGWDNVTSVRRFAASTSAIIEWQAVRPWAPESLPMLAMLVIVVIGWSRGRARPSRGEVVLVLSLVGFAFLAWRNLPSAALILAPILTGSLARALGEPDPVDRPQNRGARTAIVLAVLGASVGIVAATQVTLVVDPGVPQRLIALVRDQPGQRVLNDYDISGPLLHFAGRPLDLQVAIDGRADRYGPDYIERYLQLTRGAPGWEELLDELAPTSALLRSDSPLPGMLRAQRQWVVVDRGGAWILLRPPEATGRPTG